MVEETRQPPKIIRTEDIVVDGIGSVDKYGNLIISDKAGKEHRISVKRKRLFPIFQDGVAIHLCYASYTPPGTSVAKEYITDAVPLAQLIKPAAPKIETVAPEVPKPKGENRNRAFALSYSKDLMVASLSPEKPITVRNIRTVIKCARLFEQYLDGQLEIGEEEMAKLVLEMNKPEP